MVTPQLKWVKGGFSMARLARVSPVGVPVHVYQRGNNHQAVFEDHSN